MKVSNYLPSLIVVALSIGLAASFYIYKEKNASPTTGDTNVTIISPAPPEPIRIANPVETEPRILFATVQDDLAGYSGVEWGSSWEAFKAKKNVHDDKPSYSNQIFDYAGLAESLHSVFEIPIHSVYSLYNERSMLGYNYSAIPASFFEFFKEDEKVNYVFYKDSLWMVYLLLENNFYYEYKSKLSQQNQYVYSESKIIELGDGQHELSWILFKRKDCNTRIYLVKVAYPEHLFVTIIYIPNLFYRNLQDLMDRNIKDKDDAAASKERKTSDENLKKIE